jgi:hypothetical protein
MSERSSPSLVSYSEAARSLRVSRHTVAELAERLGIMPKPVPWNGNAKGLDPADVDRLRRALERVALSA